MQGSARAQETLVLVVDDDPAFQRRMERLLTDLGCRAIAGNGWQGAKRALERYREQIRLVILNVLIPEVSGVELTGIIRRRTSKICIIATAPPDRRPLLSACRALGANETILKNRPTETWRECIERLLNDDQNP